MRDRTTTNLVLNRANHSARTLPRESRERASSRPAAPRGLTPRALCAALGALVLLAGTASAAGPGCRLEPPIAAAPERPGGPELEAGFTLEARLRERVLVRAPDGTIREEPLQIQNWLPAPDGRRELMISSRPNATGSDVFVREAVKARDAAPATPGAAPATPGAAPGAAQAEPGAAPIRVTDLNTQLREAHWLPDGRQIVFETGTGARRAIWRVDAAAADADLRRARPAPVRVGPTDVPVYTPRVSSRGELAYLVERGRVGKSINHDVVIERDGKTHVAASNVFVFSMEWSPDGSTLAYCTPGKIVLVAEGGLTRVLRPVDAHRELEYCTSHTLAWRPDGAAIAMATYFPGGRLAVQGEPHQLYCDDKVAVFPLAENQRPRVYTFAEDILSVHWR